MIYEGSLVIDVLKRNSIRFFIKYKKWVVFQKVC